ncbi:MAG TPA: lysophospholipid acyltransferase family protein [Tepidisphaeraceae bacterium]|jgi:KDO2-lipid IV(A) lauroyltransferase|nr:lysophospholipid acyltransferase family protein [Tepidisphaeraceae bacterium]
MPKPRNDFVDRLAYIGLRITSMAMHWFPVDANLRTARLLGTIWHHFDHKHRARAVANLHRCFPEFSEMQCNRLAKEGVQNMFMLGVEVFYTTRLIRIDTWRKYIELDNFRKPLELLMTRNQGLIMLTAHYGNWEILGYVLATLGFESTAVARPLDNPYINDWVFGVRERQGQKIVGKKGATSEITQLLADGGVVGFVADQNAGGKGIFVDFFGRKASTYKSIGLLAMQYDAPVVIGYARRLGGRFRFQVGTQDIIWPKDWKDQPDPLRYITQRYTTAIETFIRDDPGQYLWVHRRWKTRPKGEQPLEYD